VISERTPVHEMRQTCDYSFSSGSRNPKLRQIEDTYRTSKPARRNKNRVITQRSRRESSRELSRALTRAKVPLAEAAGSVPQRRYIIHASATSESDSVKESRYSVMPAPSIAKRATASRQVARSPAFNSQFAIRRGVGSPAPRTTPRGGATAPRRN